MLLCLVNVLTQSTGQQLCKFIGAIERFYIRKSLLISHRTGLEQQRRYMIAVSLFWSIKMANVSVKTLYSTTGFLSLPLHMLHVA